MATRKDKTRILGKKLNDCSDKNCSTGTFTAKAHLKALNSCKNLPHTERIDCINKHIPDFKQKYSKKSNCEKKKCKDEIKELDAEVQRIFNSEMFKKEMSKYERKQKKSKTLKKKHRTK
jgi:hypothetical protein